jgi:hypothetical protein
MCDDRNPAAQEGRQLQSVVEEALIGLIEKRRAAGPRTGVMDAYRTSVAQHGAPY